MYQIVSTPNSRLIYAEAEGFPSQWQNLEARVESFIQSQPKLKLASQKTYLYFFNHPDHDLFLDEVSWVAKEIIGNPNLSPHDEELYSLDLDKGIAYQKKYTLSSFEKFYPEYLFKSFIEFRNELLSQNLHLASTWRLYFEYETEFMMVIELFIEQEE